MAPARLFTGATVVTDDAALPGGKVLVVDGVISAVLAGGQDTARLAPPDRDLLASAERIDLPGGYLVPGLVDLHVHGGGAASYDDGPAAIATAVAAHRRHGTTTTLLSLITAGEATQLRAITGAVEAISHDPRIRGIHLEGPFISPRQRGAHDPAALREPSPAALERLAAAADGHLRMVTIAPELPGGIDTIAAMVRSGIHPAVGHTDADYDTAAAAFDTGADIVTHAFNAMRPLHHRAPGVVAAARDAGVVIEAINDGVHLHDATVRLLAALAPSGLALVTDAMAAAAATDGHYRLGGLGVDVIDGTARLTDGGTIAGSTLTMDVALRRAVVEVGIDPIVAVRAATLTPARLLGLDAQLGTIGAGRRADLIVLDDDWRLRAVLLDGDWADERRP